MVCVEVTQYPAFVSLSVCLSACLLTSSPANYVSELHEHFARYVFLEKVVPTNFWKSFGSGSEPNPPRRRSMLAECSSCNLHVNTAYVLLRRNENKYYIKSHRPFASWWSGDDGVVVWCCRAEATFLWLLFVFAHASALGGGLGVRQRDFWAASAAGRYAARLSR